MKKYLKSIILLVVTVVAIGSYYINNALASKINLEIEFETLKGKESEIKNITIYGDYYNGDEFLPVTLYEGRLKENNNVSIIDKLKQEDLPPQIKKYIDKYRTFMRGKSFSLYQIYEDEYVLAYANIDWGFTQKDSTFDISVLNKENDKITSFQSKIPNKEKYSFIYVEDLQMVNGQLKVIAMARLNDFHYEVHVYTFDIGEKQLVQDEIIYSTQNSKGDSSQSSLSIIYDYSTGKQTYYLISYTSESYDKEEDQQKKVEDIILYNIETNEKEPLSLDFENAHTLSGSILTFVNYQEKYIEVTSYSVVEHKVVNTFKFPLPNKEDEFPVSTYIANGKLYIVQQTSSVINKIWVLDVETGETIYEGNIKLKHKSKDKNKINFQIYSIDVMQ